VAAADVLFQTIRDVVIEPNINYEYPLKDAVKAHQAIESGTTSGASVLLP
jgi:NADPH2:quinone reductase